MERTSTIHEVYDRVKGLFVEQARCPFCRRAAKLERTDSGYISPDPHFVRAEHGCGGNIAIFSE